MSLLRACTSLPAIMNPRRALLLAVLLIVGGMAPARAQETWPALHVRGFALRPPFQPHSIDLVDTNTTHFYNVDQTVTLMWDRDSVAESRVTFGGYSVYRSIGPYPSLATLLRRYIKQPARSFGTGEVDSATGSLSRQIGRAHV